MIGAQTLDGRLNSRGGVLRFWHPARKSESSKTREIGDLFRLHANTDDGLACQRGGHDRAYATLDDSEIRHPVDLKLRNPVRDDDIGGNPGAGNL
ncbi:MAG: hypothetical protein ACLQHF_14850 [Terracidiphilus sp.]